MVPDSTSQRTPYLHHWFIRGLSVRQVIIRHLTLRAMMILIAVAASLVAGVVGFYLGRRHTPLRFPGVSLFQPLSSGDLHEVDDGKTIRYLGNDSGAAETIWTQLERHAISGEHTWKINGKLRETRSVE